MLTDILPERLAATVESLQARGFTVAGHNHDVTQAEQWAEVLRATLSRFGRLDVVVNNAGITTATTIEDLTLEELRRVFDINFVGCFLGTQLGIRHMKDTGGGSIINIASNATRNVIPQTAAYGPSKAAVANLTKVAAVHCATRRYNIRVNSVHPGPTETEMLTGGAARAMDIPEVARLIESVPMGRMGQPREIAEVVAFLATEAASYMTGAELFIDGGLTVSMSK
jgi:3alpha(or 20beta)-hydroxysteroid dehydrogenase